MTINIDPSENQITTNRPVLNQIKHELEKLSHKRTRDDLISVGHKMRDLTQTVKYLALRDPSLRAALKHLELAQQEIENKLNRK